MPLSNRVTPYGEIVANPARGMFMGNRGCLHDDRKQIARPWRGRLWICCLTSFKDRRRELMAPGRYTELFFTDEAVALAAGHRPCAECRRQAYDNFRAALPWDGPIAEIDRLLHTERTTPTNVAVPMTELPSGAFVDHRDAPWLIWEGTRRPWSFTGYGKPEPLKHGDSARLLTPPSYVAALTAGYLPTLHPSVAEHT